MNKINNLKTPQASYFAKFDVGPADKPRDDTGIWLFLFIFIHLLCWTVAPAYIRDNLPLDSIEGSIWGHQLEWGYDKNPFMNGWLTAFATYLGGPSGWMIYLFSQLSVVACFWSVWQVAKRILTPTYALISVLLLEAIQYYNFHAIDFNDNTLELGLWGLTIYCFYIALTAPKRTWAWIGVGLFAALGMMAKYYTAALLAGMGLFLIFNADARKSFKSYGLYLGLSLFFAIILPHVVWLFHHDFITVNYVFQRTSAPPSWTNHIFFPLQFTWQQLQVFLPAAALYGILFIGKKPCIAPSRLSLTTFNRAFLYYVGLGPFLLTIMLALLFGIKLRAGWGMPLLSFWGVILISWIQPRLSTKKLYTFFLVILTLLTVSLLGYRISLIDSPDPSSANFPGQEIAQTITTEWHARYHTPLTFVAGSRWISGNIEFYSKDHPAVFIQWDPKVSPWINVADLQKNGAVFTWNISESETIPAEVKQQFPRLEAPVILSFNWRRNTHQLAPIQIGLAYLPPEKK